MTRRTGGPYLGGLCFITDRPHAGVGVVEMVRQVLDAGVAWVQYREKRATRRTICETAAELRELTARYKAVFIVNDHADIALAVDADGVHLGQDDLPLPEARRIMGSRIIGISTHDLAQAQAAAGGADYIGFGPVFETTTKEAAGAARGVDNLRVITDNVSIPVVAIGGISCASLAAVFGAGANAVAVATAVCRGDIRENSRRMLRDIGMIVKHEGG